MIKYIIIILFFFCQSLNSYGQFLDDFSNEDLSSNPTWEGDVDNFRVNEDEELQLNASDAGESVLYTRTSIPDTAVWTFDFLMDFAPSQSNQLEIYLAWDGPDTEMNHGYYLLIGENGSNDAFHFMYTEGTEVVDLGSGEMGALGGDPAYASMRIMRTPDGLWEFSVAYEKNGPYTEELIISHDAGNLEGEWYFILKCIYTASRSDLYYFDNIGVQKFVPDTKGPEILDIIVEDPLTIVVQCDEELDPESAFNAGLDISSYSGTKSTASLINNNTGIRFILTEPLEQGIPYTITVSGLRDVLMNEGESESIEVFLLSKPEPGDIAVNEILFNPVTGSVDYVEIFNASEKFLDINHIGVLNDTRMEVEELIYEQRLEPGQYLCLTEDPEDIKARYLPPDTAMFVAMDLPAFNNDTGNVSILAPLEETVLDAFNYSETMHFSGLDDLNGVALERINPYDDSQARNNWFSGSAATNYGTPGYRNSNFLNPDFQNAEVLSLEKNTFSPNQDGQDDQLIIKYNLPENGYLGDIDIYDQYGRFCRKLINNELLAEQGIILWDGLNESGEIERIGIYYIIFEAYNTSGNVIKVKKPAILADYLD